MIGKQQQEASGGSLAVQSGRDTTINDVQVIIEAIATQFPKLAAMAAEIVEVRLRDFQDHILRRFADENAGRREAFADPDFQYLIGRAQHSYARSGNPRVRDVLVDLIARRSKQTELNRLALSLNEAVAKSSRLTNNEFAELTLVYLIRDVLHQNKVTSKHLPITSIVATFHCCLIYRVRSRPIPILKLTDALIFLPLEQICSNG